MKRTTTLTRLSVAMSLLLDKLTRYRKATYDRLSKTTLANLRSDAIIFLNSALSPLLRSCFSNESDPYLLYQAIRARFEDHPTRTDPYSILRADLRVSWTPGEACDNALDLLKEHQANYGNVMQPSEWHNLSVDAYATHFWDLRYLVRASEVFQHEESVWAALRKLLQSALKNGTPPSNAAVDDTIRSCFQTRLLRTSAFGTPDSYDTRAATINAATSNAPLSAHPPSTTSGPSLTYQPTSLAAPTNSFLNPSSFFSPQAHAASTQPVPAPAPGLELAPPPAPPAVPSYAHSACHSYTGPRPICYYCGIPGHNSNHCMTLLAHYMREPKCMNVGFDPDIFHRPGKRLLEQEQRRSRRSRQSVPRHTSRDNRDPPPGGAGGSYHHSSNGPSDDRYYRDRSHDRGYGGGKRSSSSHAGPSHGAPPANTASALTTYPAPLPPYVPLPPSSASSAPSQQDPTPSFFDSGPQSPY
ncbi:hypothetical protein AC1031_021597 [Aphanomyces cochlioides]|nr:hypothetical protein AC1031_021597 [Aphanomyces cochlioides]